MAVAITPEEDVERKRKWRHHVIARRAAVAHTDAESSLNDTQLNPRRRRRVCDSSHEEE